MRERDQGGGQREKKRSKEGKREGKRDRYREGGGQVCGRGLGSVGRWESVRLAGLMLGCDWGKGEITPPQLMWVTTTALDYFLPVPRQSRGANKPHQQIINKDRIGKHYLPQRPLSSRRGTLNPNRAPNVQFITALPSLSRLSSRVPAGVAVGLSTATLHSWPTAHTRAASTGLHRAIHTTLTTLGKQHHTDEFTAHAHTHTPRLNKATVSKKAASPHS